MTKHGFVKGVAIGIAAGAALGLVASPKSRNAKRSAGKFIRAAGEIIEDISAIIR